MLNALSRRLRRPRWISRFSPTQVLPPARGAPCAAEALEPRRLLASVPSGFAVTRIVGDLASPTSMAFAPDGRLFFTEQGGGVRVVKNGSLLSTPFLTLPVVSNGERGVLGVAFDPDFSNNKHVYVFYTAASPKVHGRVSRFTADGDTVVPGSEKVLIDLDSVGNRSIHNGGALHFGKDGKLYIGVGDNANSLNAQNKSSVFGKLLRINKDGSIPADNPFYNEVSGKYRAVWAMGLRNPFTFSVQPGSGRIFINDVGQDAFEEINDGVAGANYGWPREEGPSEEPDKYKDPFHYYRHPDGDAITGGTFYNPSNANFPSSYVGDYFFADLGKGYIKKLEVGSRGVSGFATGVGKPVDLDVGPDGSLYYLTRDTSSADAGIFRVRYTGSSAPNITTQPASWTAGVGSSATFSVAATGAAPLRYQWQRNDVNISGATASSYTRANLTTADSGARFRVVVSNSAGSATSNSATLTVTTNRAPAASITSPASGSLYSGGQTFNYSGTGSDPEQGTLPSSAFTWRVDFHHATHTHPFVPPTSGGKTGSFTIPTVGETATDVWYRVYLTVKDSGGLSHTVYRDVKPRTANIRLASSPAGLRVTLDGQPVNTPTTVRSVVGVRRTLGAMNQTVNGTAYQFASWSDGGSSTHTISTPSSDRTYTATYKAATGTTNGLRATYYDNADFTGASVSRVDPAINFQWGDGSPDPSIDPWTFSARWTGQVQPQFSETYTFHTSTDDGVRLWVNNRLLIDKLTPAASDYTGTITLIGGTRYDIRMDYFEHSGGAHARLSWSSPSTPLQVVPTSRLFTGASAGATQTLTAAADATVRDGSYGGANFGASTELAAKSNQPAGYNRQSYLKFDLNSAGTIGTATLRLYGRLNGTGSTNVPVGVYSVSNTTWSEAGLTWNNKPSGGSSALDSTNVVDLNPRWYEWDVTSYLRDQKNAGRNTVSLLVKGLAASTPYVAFNSAEASSNRPQIVVTG